MRPRLWLSLAACLLLCGAARAEEFYFPDGPRPRPTLYAPPGPCVQSRLQRRCGSQLGGWIEFQPLEQRFAHNALTVRFGGAKDSPEPKVAVQVGRFSQAALFVAALIVTFLL